MPPETDQSSRAPVEDRVCVTVTWVQAKELQKMLEGVISRYEGVNGEIKKPSMDFWAGGGSRDGG